MTGDFFQLPPVCKDKETSFAFEAVSWSSVVQKTIVLKHVFRQSDPGKYIIFPPGALLSYNLVFVEILNDLRIGRVSSKMLELFSFPRKIKYPPDVEPTEL